MYTAMMIWHSWALSHTGFNLPCCSNFASDIFIG